MVRYQFARDLEGQIIHIQNLERGSVKKSTYKCLSCGNELIAKIGHIKERHFAHKAQHACSGETYLHQLGKKLFETEYLHCLSAGLPFSIEYVEEKLCNYKESKFKVCCDLGNEKKQFDLTKYFNQILVEHNFDEFRPDIMLLSSKTQEKIFIEIAVTHLSTAKKLESNIRLIEIKVEDEKDLGSISTHHIKPSWNVTFNNFKSHIIKQQHCQGKGSNLKS